MTDQEAPLVATLRADDHAAFAEHVQHHRHALHCALLSHADDAASLLGLTVVSVNSALQRARATVQRNRPPGRFEWSAAPRGQTEQALHERLMHACEQADAAAIAELLSSSVRWTMPPYPGWFDGRDAVAKSVRQGLAEFRPGEWRVVPVSR